MNMDTQVEVNWISTFWNIDAKNPQADGQPDILSIPISPPILSEALWWPVHICWFTFDFLAQRNAI